MRGKWIKFCLYLNIALRKEKEKKLFILKRGLVGINKTKDGRIIDKRVKVRKPLLNDIITKIKEDSKLTWKDLSYKLGVCDYTVRQDWMNKNNTIPLSIFKKLLKIGKLQFKDLEKEVEILEPFWGQKMAGHRATKRITIPTVKNEKLAELYGIMLGDGCVFSNMKGIAISGDKILDKDYLTVYVKKLIFDLFGVYPSYYPSSKHRSINCVVYSKALSNYFKDMGFPVGLKYKSKIVVPGFIKKDKTYLAYFVRGIMDTDGSLSSHPGAKAMIHLSITIKPLREFLLSSLNRLKIKGGEFSKGIMIYGREKISLFHDIIGFSNRKNIIKYDYFLKNGRIPSSKEVETFISANNESLSMGN